MLNSETENPKLPARFSHAKYDDVPKNVKEVFKKMGSTKMGLYLYGDCGTGKTYIAYAVMQNCIEKSKQAKMYKSTEMLDVIRKFYGKKGVDYRDNELDKLMEYKGFLIIDDIGVEKITDWVGETFYKIIDRRYEEMLPTMFTSNLSFDELAEKVGDRVPSRIAEMCKIIKLKGVDRRVP